LKLVSVNLTQGNIPFIYRTEFKAYLRSFDSDLLKINNETSPIDDGQLLLKAKTHNDYTAALCEILKLKNLLTTEESLLIRNELNLKTNDHLLTIFDLLRVRKGLSYFLSTLKSVRYLVSSKKASPKKEVFQESALILVY